MIDDIDESLQRLLAGEALNGSGVEVAFDAPTRDWAARRTGPMVDLYLYDVREDVARRQGGYERVRENGMVAARRPAPRCYRLSYLVTAWTQRTQDEHRVLSSLLSCFLRHEVLPADALSPPLAQQGVTIRLTVALPPPHDRSISDVWSALGGELKPSLDLVVVAPFDPERVQAAGPPVLAEPVLHVVRRPDGPAETAGGRRGDVPD